jgi:hypothetical protein
MQALSGIAAIAAGILIGLVFSCAGCNMPKIWGLAERKKYWASFFSATEAGNQRKPLLWVCQNAPTQEKLLREEAHIYDPFIGFALPEKVATCLGILNTRGYISKQGLTVELKPIEAIPNPVSLSHLVAMKVIPDWIEGNLATCGTLQPLEVTHWNRVKSVLAEMNPSLTTSLVIVENWRQRRGFLEHILEIIARRGCSEEQEQELFTILCGLMQSEPEPHESFGQLALQTRLRLALNAQLLPEREWEQLYQRVVDNWYGYLMTLTPQEIHQLTNLRGVVQP